MAAAATATRAAAAAKMASSHRKGGKGKAARRAASHNADNVLDYLDALESAADLDTLELYMERNAIQLARVTRTPGGRLLKVTLQDGTKDTDVVISGTLGLRGRASTKAHVSSCMSVNDVIVLEGGRASGKIPPELFGSIQGAFDRLGVRYPDGFFLKGTSDATASTTALGYDWETDEAAAKASLTKSAKGRTGAGGGAAAAAEDADIDVSTI
jgi:hypothetical protein